MCNCSSEEEPKLQGPSSSRLVTDVRTILPLLWRIKHRLWAPFAQPEEEGTVLSLRLAFADPATGPVIATYGPRSAAAPLLRWSGSRNVRRPPARSWSWKE